MTTKAAAAELRTILEAAREQLIYLSELGVALVEPSNLPAASPRHAQDPAHKDEAVSARGRLPVPRPSTNAASVLGPKTLPSIPTRVLFENLIRTSEQLTKSNETLEDIHAEIGDCTLCGLCERRRNVVHTEGNRKARLMFIGEAPGADEDAQARPFVGRAGQLLTKIIEAIGFRREEVLIGNVNRCRPPGNRPPTDEEAAVCKPFLLREIASVQPEVIVVLGNTATRNLLETRESIGRLRGQFLDYKGIKVMPTFHPAYLLRDPSKKRETWEDLKKVRAYLDSATKV